MNKFQERMPPGSPEAIASHCTCPVADNAHGQGSGYTDGDGEPVFWVNENCPLHSDKPEFQLPDSI